MGVVDFFRPISSWSAEKVRKFLLEHKAEDYQLVDVRQPREYLRGHLPGALPAPLDRLREEIRKLDARKTTLTYSSVGMRGRAAAATLRNAGFTDVHNLEGGTNAWRGNPPEGNVEMGMPCFSSARTLGEFIGLSWLIEKTTRSFYIAMAEHFSRIEGEAFFRQMAGVEERHQAFLGALFEKMSGHVLGEDGPRALLPSLPEEPILEGGVRLQEALRWAASRSLTNIVQFAISFEAIAHDRYLLMAREQKDEDVKDLFEVMAEEEKTHLLHLTRYLNHLLPHP